MHLHHIAVLVKSLSSVEKSLPGELERLSVEHFPNEGTREQYIDLSPSGRPSLLLIEAVGDGPYRSALQRRGAGLHHLGFVTDHLSEAADHFARQGLLLHPITLKTLEQRVIWMCRPGIPFLVEAVGVDELEEPVPPTITMAIPGLEVDRIDWAPDLSISRSDDALIRVSTDGVSFQMSP